MRRPIGREVTAQGAFDYAIGMMGDWLAYRLRIADATMRAKHPEPDTPWRAHVVHVILPRIRKEPQWFAAHIRPTQLELLIRMLRQHFEEIAAK